MRRGDLTVTTSGAGYCMAYRASDLSKTTVPTGVVCLVIDRADALSRRWLRPLLIVLSEGRELVIDEAFLVKESP